MCLNRHEKHQHGHGKRSRRSFMSTLIPGAVLASGAFAQQAPPAPGDMAERFRRMSDDAEKKGLAEPFKGIVGPNGVAEQGLFPVKSTGVSTAAVRNAAERFLGTLSAPQRQKAVFPLDDPEWRKWMNQHFYMRQGVSFKELSESQKTAAFGLLKAGLSARGLELTRNIMKLNETLAEMSDDHVWLGEWLYYLTFFGKPSATEPWGWQLDGHHCIINYFVMGDQVVMTPHFFGSEPVRAESGKYKGTVILQEEQDRGLEMLTKLDEAQQKKAVLNFSKTGNNNLGEAFKDNITLDYAGVRAADIGSAGQKRLMDLVHLYVSNMDDGHARVKMDEVKKHLDRTTFAWIGQSAPDSAFYYRIHSPVILVEFDHQTPANLRRFSKNPQAPNRDHIHCVVRTPNGNDYGKDLLRQHYLAHPHT